LIEKGRGGGIAKKKRGGAVRLRLLIFFSATVKRDWRKGGKKKKKNCQKGRKKRRGEKGLLIILKALMKAHSISRKGKRGFRERGRGRRNGGGNFDGRVCLLSFSFFLSPLRPFR